MPFVYSFRPPDQAGATSLPAGVVGVPVDFSPLPTIELALRLHPEAKRLVLITGAGPWDIAWEKRLRRDTAALRERVALEFLAGLPTAEVFARLSALPKNTIVFTPGYFRDGAGTVFATRDTVSAMAARSTAPVYVAYETNVGTGAVGGVMPTFEAVGRQTGEIVAAILEGKQPAELKLPEIVQGGPVVDWQQIRRWRIDERLLPADAEVRFREISPWEKYWREISIALAVFVLQTALIIALIVARRRRQRTAAALAQSEQRMGLAARAARISLWTWDISRDKVWVTSRSRQQEGARDQQPFEIDNFLELVHPADREKVRRAGREALAKNAELDTEYRVAGHTGEMHWIAARGRVEQPDGPQITGVAIDITDHKRAELQVEQDRIALRHMSRVSLLGQLLASIAHELNQPLAAILGNAEAACQILAREPVDLAELREICNDIVKEDHRAAEVILHLRELFKRGEMKREPLNVNTLVGETLDLVSGELLTRHVSVVTDLVPSLPLVSGDHVQLKQVLLNLILNAADAVSVQVIESRIVTIRSEMAGTEIRLSVADKGPGIADEDLKNIFGAFWSTKQTGMGIGLAICKTIVDAHAGSITAINNPDGGATFCVTLPAQGAA